MLLAEMSWPEVKERVAAGAVAVLPVASTEQHGPHLPLSTDARIVGECGRRAAEAVADEVAVVVAPTMPFGFSEHHMDIPGTLTLSMPTYIAALTELGDSLARHGFGKLLFLNGHGGNHEAVQVVVRQLLARHHVVAAAASYWDVARAALRQAGSDQVGLVPGHSAGFETTLMLALQPDLVAMERLPDADRSLPGPGGSRRTLAGMGAMSAVHRSQQPHGGVWGDPRLVRPEFGPALLDAIVGALADLYRALARTDSY